MFCLHMFTEFTCMHLFLDLDQLTPNKIVFSYVKSVNFL